MSYFDSIVTYHLNGLIDEFVDCVINGCEKSKLYWINIKLLFYAAFYRPFPEIIKRKILKLEKKSRLFQDADPVFGYVPFLLLQIMQDPYDYDKSSKFLNILHISMTVQPEDRFKINIFISLLLNRYFECRRGVHIYFQQNALYLDEMLVASIRENIRLLRSCDLHQVALLLFMNIDKDRKRRYFYELLQLANKVETPTVVQLLDQFLAKDEFIPNPFYKELVEAERMLVQDLMNLSVPKKYINHSGYQLSAFDNLSNYYKFSFDDPRLQPFLPTISSEYFDY